jgi:hypothetical protein
MASSPAEVARSPRLAWLVPAVLVVVFIAAVAGVLLFARQAAESDAPPPAAAFVPPPGLAYVAFDVERNDGGVLRVVSGGGQQSAAIDVTLGTDAKVWLLEPAALEDLQAPMVVNVISIPNEVRNFSIHLLAFAPANGSEALGAEFVPLADGFAGHETSRDGRERPVVSGVVERFDGKIAFVKTEAGQATIEIDPGAPVRLLRGGTAGEVRPGDRVAFHRATDGSPDVSRGVLVLTNANPD